MGILEALGAKRAKKADRNSIETETTTKPLEKRFQVPINKSVTVVITSYRAPRGGKIKHVSIALPYKDDNEFRMAIRQSIEVELSHAIDIPAEKPMQLFGRLENDIFTFPEDEKPADKQRKNV